MHLSQTCLSALNTPVIGFRLVSTQCVHLLHPGGSIPARRHFIGVHNAKQIAMNFKSYRVST